MSYEHTSQARLDELVKIEKKYAIAKLIKTHPSAQGTGIDGTMSRWLSGILLRTTTPEQTLTAWRALQTRGERLYPRDFSEKQQEFLNMSDAEVFALSVQAQELKKKRFDTIPEIMTARTQEDSGHAFNDRHQVRQKEKRSLSRLREEGMQITITAEHIEQLQELLHTGADCPVLDKMKNEPILTINGFTGSKVALTIHDLFDHFWTFHTFDQHGLLERYADFLQSVGNPQHTDIFKREGELIASISYEWRSTFSPERSFRPILQFSDLVRLFDKHPKSQTTPNQIRAQQILQSMRPDSPKAEKLAAMYSGVLVELMEQRRKHGYIRKLDASFTPTEVLPLLDREYLALVVEGAHLMMQPENRTQEALFTINVLVEDFFIRAAQDPSQLTLSVTAQTIQEFDPSTSAVSEERQDWLWKNFFHTATRINACS